MSERWQRMWCGVIVGSLAVAVVRDAAAQAYEPPSNVPVDVDSDGAAVRVKEAKMDDATRTGLLIASAVTFGVAYLTPVILGAPYGYADQGGWLFVPVAGPVLNLAARTGCGEPDTRDCRTADNFVAPGLITATLVQVAGVGMLIGGLLYEGESGEAVEINPSFNTSSAGFEVRGVW